MKLAHNFSEMFAVYNFNDKRHVRSMKVFFVNSEVINIGILFGNYITYSGEDARFVLGLNNYFHLKFPFCFFRPIQVKIIIRVPHDHFTVFATGSMNYQSSATSRGTDNLISGNGFATLRKFVV